MLCGDKLNDSKLALYRPLNHRILRGCLSSGFVVVLNSMRVLFISVVSVVVLFVVLTMTRLWGLGQQFPPFEHPFFANTSGPLLILRTENEKELQEAVAAKPDVVIWLDVETTSDKKVITFSRDFTPKEMSIEAYRGPKSFAYQYQQLQIVHPDVRELHDIVAKYPQQRFVMNVTDNVENVHKWITESLKDLAAEKRILLQSNYNVIMTSIKELQPFWLYGCSQADLMRFLTFDSMWILPATPFKGDVYISPFKLLGRPAFHENILEEVRRRNKKIILGPAIDKSEYDDAVRLKADGIIVENLSDFLVWTRP
jgi:hypothetical protein